jgi:hypothetical protein
MITVWLEIKKRGRREAEKLANGYQVIARQKQEALACYCIMG